MPFIIGYTHSLIGISSLLCVELAALSEELAEDGFAEPADCLPELLHADSSIPAAIMDIARIESLRIFVNSLRFWIDLIKNDRPCLLALKRFVTTLAPQAILTVPSEAPILLPPAYINHLNFENVVVKYGYTIGDMYLTCSLFLY